MRINLRKKKEKNPELGDYKFVNKFAWLPKKFKNHWIWLHKYQEVYEYQNTFSNSLIITNDGDLIKTTEKIDWVKIHIYIK